MSDEQVTSGIGDLRDRVGNLERGLADNTATTKRIESDTAEMLDIFKSWQGAMKVLEMVGKAAKPMAAIASLLVAVGASWGTMKGWFK